jgi:hypothetical protein
MVQVIALAQYTLAYTSSGTANSPNQRLRLAARSITKSFLPAIQPLANHLIEESGSQPIAQFMGLWSL